MTTVASGFVSFSPVIHPVRKIKQDSSTPSNLFLTQRAPLFSFNDNFQAKSRRSFLNRSASLPVVSASLTQIEAETTTTITRSIYSSVVSEKPISTDFLHNISLVADLDPGTAKLAIGILGPALSAFGFLFIVRIVMSWYPKLPVEKFPYVLAYAPTEPILVQTRKVIPPLAGVDVTPVVWFGLVSFLSEILVGPQGLLVLVSQQTS